MKSPVTPFERLILAVVPVTATLSPGETLMLLGPIVLDTVDTVGVCLNTLEVKRCCCEALHCHTWTRPPFFD